MELRIFPLNAVLFPGADMPLHIFEERYKLMMGECLRERRPFGVALIRQGREVGEPAEPLDVGTIAQIAAVERLPEGRMNLVCVGADRFRIVRHISREPYLKSEVDVLAEPVEEDEETLSLAQRVADIFSEYAGLEIALSGGWSRETMLPSAPGSLADQIASRLPLGLPAKQRLLEELSARMRLNGERVILSAAVRRLQPLVASAHATRWQGLPRLN